LALRHRQLEGLDHHIQCIVAVFTTLKVAADVDFVSLRVLEVDRFFVLQARRAGQRDVGL
jgi:hypothetical protein